MHAGETDQPIAALIADLKRTGLWDETLLVWGGEFGRTPTSEGVGKPGRDHNWHGFSMWLAGAGVKGGQAIGATDELGFGAVEDPCHVSDLHATILHLMGLDHERLTYFYEGLDQRLTGVGHLHGARQSPPARPRRNGAGRPTQHHHGGGEFSRLPRGHARAGPHDENDGAGAEIRGPVQL